MQTISKKNRLLALIGFLAYSLILLALPLLVGELGIQIASISTVSLVILKIIALILSILGLIMAWLFQSGRMQSLIRPQPFLIRISPETKPLLYSYLLLLCPMIYGLFLFFCGMPITEFYYFVGVAFVVGIVFGTYDLSKP